MIDDKVLIFSEIDKIIAKYEQISQKTGEKFNIFKILNITTDEVRLHSKFLAELLNPKGSHGQGDNFLSLFTKQIDCEDFKTKNANVIVEKYIGKINDEIGGRIDILIENNENQTIIIENKIYAKDQDNQLIRYSNYKKDSVLYYLTLHGKPPKNMSFGNLKLDKDFYLLSYKHDIVEWLEKCSEISDLMPLIKEGINHYINLIRYLTGQSNNKQMDRDITELLIENRDILKKSVVISNNIENVKIKLQWLFWEYLKKEFQNKLNDINLHFEESKERKIVTWQRVHDYYVKGRSKDLYYGLWIKIYEKSDTKIYYSIKIQENIYYGFTIEKSNNNQISDKPEYENIRKFVREINNYTHNKNWLGWKNTDELLNFRKFASENIYNLAGRSKLQETVAKIVESSINDISLLKDELQKIQIND